MEKHTSKLEIDVIQFLPSDRSEPIVATNSENGPQLLEEYAKSLPNITAQHYHSEFLLEAQEPIKSEIFATTLIGRLPPEIREMIYANALSTEKEPEYLKSSYKTKYYGHYGSQKLERRPPGWCQDHMPVTEGYLQRCWPRGQDRRSSYQFPFIATFPPRRNPSMRSRLALLLTCRQIYNEAWHIYYSIHRFVFRSTDSFLHFRDKVTTARRQAVTSVKIRIKKRPIIKTLQYLATDFPALRHLYIELQPEDAKHLALLSELRGLRRVKFLFDKRKPEERVLLELKQLRAMLLRPRQDSEQPEAKGSMDGGLVEEKGDQ